MSDKPRTFEEWWETYPDAAETYEEGMQDAYEAGQKSRDEEVAAKDRRIEELVRELAISMRVCGNWREFPGAPNAELKHDWQYALRAIEENKSLQAQIDRVRALAEEWKETNKIGAEMGMSYRISAKVFCLCLCANAVLTALSEPAAEPEREP